MRPELLQRARGGRKRGWLRCKEGEGGRIVKQTSGVVVRRRRRETVGYDGDE
jgi:hypothetical protein